MPNTSKKAETADQIAERASRGQDVSAYFTGKFTVVRPAQRVNVDLTPGMLRKIDHRAALSNTSREAVTKTLLGQALDGAANSRRPRKTND